MLRILQQPAPYIFGWKSLLIRHFFIGAFIAFFLIGFQPFGTADVQMPNKSLYLSGYGWITFIVFSLLYLILPKIFTGWFNEEEWKVWKEIVLVLFALSITFFCCYCYLGWLFGLPFSFKTFFQFYPRAFSLSIFPCVVIALSHYIYQLKKHQTIATAFNEQIDAHNTTTVVSTLSFNDENDREDLTIPKDRLLFLKAANNYVEVYYLDDNKVKMHLLRNRLSKLEEQLSDKRIIRCHRSYLVNLDKAERITGNAQGYKLHFPFTAEYVVPVSRTKGKELVALLQGL